MAPTGKKGGAAAAKHGNGFILLSPGDDAGSSFKYIARCDDCPYQSARQDKDDALAEMAAHRAEFHPQAS